MAPFSATEPGQFPPAVSSSTSDAQLLLLPSVDIPAVVDAGDHCSPAAIPAAGVRRKRVQHYLRRIKRLVRERWPSDVRRPAKIGTMEALERAVELIRHSTATTAATITSTAAANPPNDDADAALHHASSTAADALQKPMSPWAAGSAGSPDAGPRGAASPQSAATADGPTSAAASDAAQQESCSAAAAPADLRRHVGTVIVKLPEGTILEMAPPPSSAEIAGGEKLEEALRVGENLLEKLHGKGAQTLLLNAFCGHAKRRMYARLKWTDAIRAYEFLCEFRVDAANPATRVARIDVLSVDTTLHSAAVLGASRAVFITRHNAACAIVYLDSASIPFLGHFPSEITGKSLFALLSPEDAAVVKQAHRKLHDTNGQIVATPGLRLLSYAGDVVHVDSEWSAFVNPWTHHIEMVVGRHTVVPPPPPQQTAEKENHLLLGSSCEPAEERQEHGSLGAFIEDVVETLVTTNGGQTSTPQSVHKFVALSPRALSDRGTPASAAESQGAASGAVSLSYNQINCLENVHRLLKSQNHANELPSPPIQTIFEDSTTATTTAHPATGSPAAGLTRELLQQHDRRWEADCKDTWRRRLTQKRRSDERSGSAAGAAAAKMPRRCEALRQEGGSKGNSVRTDSPSTPSNANYQITSVPIPLTSASAYAVEPMNLSTTIRKRSTGTAPPPPHPPPQFWTDYSAAMQRVMQRGGGGSAAVDGSGGDNVSAAMQLLQLAQRAHLEQRQQQLYAAALQAITQQQPNTASGAQQQQSAVDPSSFLSMLSSTFHN